MPGNSEIKLQLIIEAFSRADAAFNEVKRNLKDAQAETDALREKSGRLESGISSLIGRYVTLAAVVMGVKTAAGEAISYLSQIETATLGIGAAFMVGGKYIDETSGKALSASDALKAAQGDARDIIHELEYANLQTIATLDELINAYQVTLPVALAKGFNRDQVKEFTVAMVQAAGAIGLQMNQLGEETRSLLTGAIDPRTSRIATVLGLRNEDINQFKGNAGGLFDFLMGKLSAYKTAGVEAQNTWAGLWSNTKDIALQGLGKAFEPLFEGLKYDLKSFADSIVTIDDKAKKITWNPAFLEGVKNFRDGVEQVIADFYRMGMLLDRIGGTLSILKLDPQMNDMFRQRYMDSERALQDMAMRQTGGWKPVTPDIDKQMREAAANGKKLFEQIQINVGNPDEATRQLLRYYREIGGKGTTWQANPQPDPTKAGEKVQIEKKALEATIERYKAEAEAGVEANKAYVSGRRLALEQGLIDQKEFLDEQARMEEASGKVTLEYLQKKEAAIIASYAKQREVLAKGEPVKAAVAGEEESKALADVRGAIARERSKLIEVEIKGKVDSIEYSKKLAAAEREGELAVMTEIARLENEANRLKVERDKMTAPEALRVELDWEIRLNSKKRENLALDLAAATDDSQKAKIQAQIAVLDKALQDSEVRRLKKAEADKKAAAELRAYQEAEIQGQLAQIDMEESSGKAHRATLNDRIRLTAALLSIQQEYLATLDKGKDPASWYAQSKAIDETRAKIVGLRVELKAATGTSGEGAAKGWQDWINNTRSAFDQGKELATSTAGAMNTAFSDIFFDAWMGKLQSAGDYLRSFAQTILRTLANVLSEMIVKWALMQVTSTSAAGSAVAGINAEIASVAALTAAYYSLAAAKAVAGVISAAGGAAGGVSGSTAVAGGYAGGSYAGFHRGGMSGEPSFFRIVPAAAFAGAQRAHSGIGPGEKPVIIRDDEGVFTPGQMKALGLMAGNRAPEVRVDIANIVSPELLDTYLATPRGQNAILNVVSSRAGTLRKILR